MKKIPRVEAGNHTLSGQNRPLPKLHMFGDYNLPGIGMPDISGSGTIVANNLISVSDHWKILDKITFSGGREGD